MRLDLHSIRQRARRWLSSLEALPERQWLLLLFVAVAARELSAATR